MSITTPEKRRSFIERNNSPCSRPGCPQARKGTSKWCSKHASAVRRYGHAEGKAITKKDLHSFFEAANDFIDRHASHQGIQQAISFLDQLITSAASDFRAHLPLNRELVRLSEEGLSGREALALVVAVHMFSVHRPRELPTGQGLIYAYANVLLKARPQSVVRSWHEEGVWKRQYRRVGSKVRRNLGRHIMRTLGGLLVNIQEYQKKETDDEIARNMSLRQPFTPNDSK